MGRDLPGRLPVEFAYTGGPSFADYLRVAAPELLPGRRPLPPSGALGDLAPHGTTIVAMTYAGGVLLAGDRRATMGNLIAQRDIRKVFPADTYSAIAFAGTAGIGLELMRLFRVELEHYEKIEGTSLSLPAKANRLAAMVRDNLGAAIQGLAVVPLFTGYDPTAADPATAGRIYSYDVTGGPYEERDFHAVGSGSLFAKSALKKRYSRDVDADGAVRLAVESLYDAAEDDTATGGPDLARSIFPIVALVDADGFRELPEEDVAAVVRSVVEERMQHPGG
ncbi:proteasome subunit beta [Actinocatenispora comari]|nr:proteasome subunit beta [Actinocatenispora comari]